jgi:very-short-patch-repair endonuclease
MTPPRVASQGEARLLWQCRALRLPEPTREFRFMRFASMALRFCWPAHRVAVEVDGGTWTNGRHVRGAGFERDCEKFNEALLLGWLPLRVTTAMVDDGRALELVRRALEFQEA